MQNCNALFYNYFMSRTNWYAYFERVKGDETNAAVAKKFDISEATISRWKTGLLPKPKQAVEIARAYGDNPIAALVAAGFLAPEDLEDVNVKVQIIEMESMSTAQLLELLTDRVLQLENSANSENTHTVEKASWGEYVDGMNLDSLDIDRYSQEVAAQITLISDMQGIKPAQLARMTGISDTAIRRYLDGDREIPIKAFTSIAKALDTKPADILAAAYERIESENTQPTQTPLSRIDAAFAAVEQSRNQPATPTQLPDDYDLTNPDPEYGLAAREISEQDQQALNQYNQHAE